MTPYRALHVRKLKAAKAESLENRKLSGVQHRFFASAPWKHCCSVCGFTIGAEEYALAKQRAAYGNREDMTFFYCPERAICK